VQRDDRPLIGLFILLAVGTLTAFTLLPLNRPGLSRPGDPLGQSLGIAGSLLMLFGLSYPLVKRTRLSGLKMRWMDLHIILGAIGAALVTLHMAGRFGKPPALLWLAVVGLVLLGVYGRLMAARFVHAQFVSNPYAFLPSRPEATAPLHALVGEKEALLAHLEPGAREAVFTLAPRHWLGRPLLAARYQALTWREERLVRAQPDRRRGAHHLLQRWWRVAHIALAFAVLVGLLAHVVTVLFFAGYAAEGGEIYWWHLRI
jgi:hypothetical protein